MIARPHICLRCQYHLARRSAPSKTGVAFQSTDAGPHRPTIVPDDLKVQDRPYTPIKRPLKLSRRPLGPPKTLSEHPLGKLYGYTGQQLRENREKLDVDVFGEATEVIVLRDSKISKIRHRYEEDAEAREGIDILAKLDEERGLVGQEEVERNINDFRPSNERRPRTREQFSELLTGLQSGFTVSQLARYLQAHGQKDTAAPQLRSTSLILRISPWMPGISESNDPLDSDQLRGYDLQSYTSKQRLVLRLLRECWKLELPFVEEGIGQIEVELNPGDLDLLLKGANSPLSSIHSKHIVGSEERLESFRSNDAKRSRNSIRITTTRTKCYLVVEEIDRVLNGIRRIRLPLKALMEEGEKSDFRKWVNTQFDDSVIEELGRLTNTDIRKTHGSYGSSLFISSVEANPDSVFCTKPDTARRLVLTSGNFSDRETTWVGCKDTPNAAEGTFVKYPLIEGLAWRDRLRQWRRWVVPVSKETDVQSQNQSLDPTIGEFGRQVAPEIAKPLATQPQGAKLQVKSHVAYWSDELSVQSSALMGSVLYDHSQPPSSTEGSQRRILFADAVRSFSTSVPNISRILTTAVGSDPSPTEKVIMRFLPNPFSPSPTKKGPIGSEALSAFPPIEMTFIVDPVTRVLGLNFIQAVISTENSDLMLPDSPIDIRFQQRTTKRLCYTHTSVPTGVAHFLSKSNLSLDFSRGGLNTPPSLMIPIAAHMSNSPGFELLGPGTKDAEMQEVEYLFAGLEIRKTISMDFEGWRLVYTSVEAGKAGGRRGELRLRPTRTVESDDPKLESEEAFLESAFRLADASYTSLKVRKVVLENLRMVPTYGGRSPDRIFKCFAKRPTITFNRECATGVDEGTGERLLEDDESDEKDGHNDVVGETKNKHDERPT